MVISLYVDDILITVNKLEMIHEFKVDMKKVFEMKDLEELPYFLGRLQISEHFNLSKRKID